MSVEQIERDEYRSIVLILSKLEFSYSAFSNKYGNMIGIIYTIIINIQCASSAF